MKSYTPPPVKNDLSHLKTMLPDDVSSYLTSFMSPIDRGSMYRAIGKQQTIHENLEKCRLIKSKIHPQEATMLCLPSYEDPEKYDKEIYPTRPRLYFKDFLGCNILFYYPQQRFHQIDPFRDTDTLSSMIDRYILLYKSLYSRSKKILSDAKFTLTQIFAQSVYRLIKSEEFTKEDRISVKLMGRLLHFFKTHIPLVTKRISILQKTIVYTLVPLLERSNKALFKHILEYYDNTQKKLS